MFHGAASTLFFHSSKLWIRRIPFDVIALLCTLFFAGMPLVTYDLNGAWGELIAGIQRMNGVGCSYWACASFAHFWCKVKQSCGTSFKSCTPNNVGIFGTKWFITLGKTGVVKCKVLRVVTHRKSFRDVKTPLLLNGKACKLYARGSGFDSRQNQNFSNKRIITKEKNMTSSKWHQIFWWIHCKRAKTKFN